MPPRASSIRFASLDDLIPFRSKAEGDAYLDRPEIECLICGCFFKHLAVHLARGHKIDTYAYRVALALPLGVGLCGSGLRSFFSEFAKENLKTNKKRQQAFRNRSPRKPGCKMRRSPALKFRRGRDEGNRALTAKARARLSALVHKAEKGDTINGLERRLNTRVGALHRGFSRYPDIYETFKKIVNQG